MKFECIAAKEAAQREIVAGIAGRRRTTLRAAGADCFARRATHADEVARTGPSHPFAGALFPVTRKE